MRVPRRGISTARARSLATLQESANRTIPDRVMPSGADRPQFVFLAPCGEHCCDIACDGMKAIGESFRQQVRTLNRLRLDFSLVIYLRMFSDRWLANFLGCDIVCVVEWWTPRGRSAAGGRRWTTSVDAYCRLIAQLLSHRQSRYRATCSDEWR